MSNNNSALFNQDLSLKMILDADGKKTELLAGNIEDISLELHSYGFTGTIHFTGIDNDELNTIFHSKKPIKVTLTFASIGPESKDPLLELKGIATERRWKRVDEVSHGKKLPIYQYQIVVSDNAKVTWEEHFPLNIYVNKSMKEVIEDHKNPEIDIKYDFPPLEIKYPITSFSLCYNDHLPQTKQRSFYLFLSWYLHQEGGVLDYDYKENAYSILAKKKPAAGTPFKINEWLVIPPSGLVPPEPRFNTKIIKHDPDTMDPEDKENENSFKSVRRDSIDPGKYRIFPAHSLEKVESPLERTLPEMELQPIHFEGDFNLNKLIPGSFITFTTDELSWTSDPLIKDKVFRSRVMFFSAIRQTGSATHKPIQPYQLSIRTIFEPQDEVYIERPSFTPPVFPFEIEGTIFSDIGDEEQSTFKTPEEEKAPLGQYLVLVPLAGEDLQVVVPFTPNLTSGQCYFPYLKDEKVLLDMFFRTAQIKKVVDWNKLVRLPNGIQGVQTVFASNGQDEYSILKHEYEDGTDSVVTLKQSTSAAQCQTITIKNKEILISVVEKDKKTILMRYNNDEGISISFIDEASNALQQIMMDGKQITQTCKDSSDTSTFVQTPTAFTLTAKEFNIVVDNIKTDIKEDVNYKAGSKINLEAPVINAKGDMKVGG